MFAACCVQDVQKARQEATENVRFLEPLRKLLEKLNTMDDFVALSDHFKPLLHSMLLIWKLSSSYSSSARFATLLREICNDLIMQVRTDSGSPCHTPPSPRAQHTRCLQHMLRRPSRYYP